MPEGIEDQTVNTGGEGDAGGNGVFAEMFPEDSREMFSDFQDPESFVKHYKDMSGKVKTLEGKVPVVPEKYEDIEGITVPEEAKENFEQVQQFAKDLGLSQDKYEKLVKGLVQHDQELFKQVQSGTEAQFEKELQAQEKETVKILQSEWGGDYERKLGEAQKFVANSGDDALIKYLNETGLGNDPGFIQWMYKISTHFKEDDFSDGKIEDNDIKRGPDGEPVLRFKSMK